MSEYYRGGKFMGEIDDLPDDSELKPHEPFYSYDALTSLTLDYLSQDTAAKKEEFVTGLRKTLNIPEVSKESKNDIKRFLEKLEKDTLGN